MTERKPIRITSTEFRDAQQSLLATRLKTEDMLPILETMDRVGYHCVEMWGGATFDACIRFLGDDPWERIREFKKRMPHTPLRMLLRGQNVVGYRQYPDDVVERFVEKAAETGIDIFLIFDSLNDLRNCETAISAVRRAGKSPEGNILYTISPVHQLEQYVEVAKRFESLGVLAIHLEDMAGILTPDTSFRLIKALKKTLEIPVHIHCHCTGGMADMAYLKAIEAGVDVIDTAVSALALGTSQPPTESFVVALRESPHDTGFDLNILAEINRYFLGLREKYREFESRYTGVDISVLQHQIPGGMMSNLESQLKEQKALSKLNRVLEEVHRVRKDLGYPPLGTPSSQIVGTQATLNVLLGEQYKIVTKETGEYIRGMYGVPPGDINRDLLKQVLGSGKRIECRPADLLAPELEKLRKEVGDLARTDEDLLTYAMFPQVAESFLEKKYGINESNSLRGRSV